jgi:hypothetical protein
MQQLRPTPSEEAWEWLPYLDRIWSCRQLPLRERSRLLEMHRAGLLLEGELTRATLRALNSCGLDAKAVRSVLIDFWQQLKASEQGLSPSQSSHLAWKDLKLLELLHKEVTPS